MEAVQKTKRYYTYKEIGGYGEGESFKLKTIKGLVINLQEVFE